MSWGVGVICCLLPTAIGGGLRNPKCNHILSYGTGVDESWLVYQDRAKEDPSIRLDDDVKFNFCPLCGERLEKLV